MALSSETSFLKRLLSWSDDRSRFAFVAQITVKQTKPVISSPAILQKSPPREVGSYFDQI